MHGELANYAKSINHNDKTREIYRFCLSNSDSSFDSPLVEASISVLTSGRIIFSLKFSRIRPSEGVEYKSF